MDDLLKKAGDILFQLGLPGLVIGYLAWQNYRKDLRIEKLVEELQELAKDAYGVLAVIKDKIK
jgi:hypothetical protein